MTGVETSSRKDIFEVMVAYNETEEAKALTGEKKRALARQLRDGKRLGLHLDNETAGKVKDINTKLSENGIKFSKNLGEEDYSCNLSLEQLGECRKISCRSGCKRTRAATQP